MNLKALIAAAVLLFGLMLSAGFASAATSAAELRAASAPTASRTISLPLVLSVSPGGTSNNRPPVPPAVHGGVYTGVSLPGVPWDMGPVANWEQNVAGKGVSIVGFWSFWANDGTGHDFAPHLMDAIRNHGSIPMVTWAPEQGGAGPNQPDYRLSNIIAGRFDSYITKWADSAKQWGHPFFLRFAHEADGEWFAWAEGANGNQRGEYVQAWRHVHDLFQAAGATNATWVWCPNVQWKDSPRPSYASLYPGDSYVDWTCVDAYNWGSDYPANGGWQTFDQIFRYAYDRLVEIAPSKPIMLGEWATSSTGGSKGEWVADAFGVQIPNHYPQIKAEVWYNWVMNGVDWRVESSTGATRALAGSLASSVYRGAEYQGLGDGPIPAP